MTDNYIKLQYNVKCAQKHNFHNMDMKLFMYFMNLPVLCGMTRRMPFEPATNYSFRT